MLKRGRLKLSEVKVSNYKHQKLNNSLPYPNSANTFDASLTSPIDYTSDNILNSMIEDSPDSTSKAIQTNNDHKISIDSQTNTSIELINKMTNFYFWKTLHWQSKQLIYKN